MTPKGKVVYGGGGIIPDVFVPIGSNEEEAVESMDGMGWFSRFVFQHLDDNRAQYKNYTQKEFEEDYTVDDILFEDFIDYLVAGNLKMNFYDYETPLKNHIKAALAEQLYSSNIYAKIKSSQDAMLQKVLELDAAQ